jgi:hypothetical protein
MSRRASAAADPGELLARHEKAVPRLTAAEELKTLVCNQKYGTICTMASSGKAKGYPSGAIMPYCVDTKGKVIACLSNLSPHKR